MSGRSNPKVDFFFTAAESWRAEFNKLRKILLECPVTEELKWGKPCYTWEGANIAILQGFKEYCALLFVKGVLLKDPSGLLVQQTENVQAARQLRFTDVREIQEPVVKAYVLEAIAVEKSGVEIKYKKTADFKMPEELKKKFAERPDFKTAFQALTPGRQRGYLLYFSAAQQAKTREARIEKCLPRIFQGIGWNE